MTDRCKAMVYSGNSFCERGCYKPAWKDGFCSVHHPDLVAQRRLKREGERFQKWIKESAESMRTVNIAAAKDRIVEAARAVNAAGCSGLEHETKKEAYRALVEALGALDALENRK